MSRKKAAKVAEAPKQGPLQGKQLTPPAGSGLGPIQSKDIKSLQFTIEIEPEKELAELAENLQTFRDQCIVGAIEMAKDHVQDKYIARVLRGVYLLDTYIEKAKATAMWAGAPAVGGRYMDQITQAAAIQEAVGLKDAENGHVREAIMEAGRVHKEQKRKQWKKPGRK